MDLPSPLSRFTPRFDALYLPLKQTPPETLTAANHPLGWIFRVMREEDAPTENMESVYQAATLWLTALPKEEQAVWAEVLHFLWLLVQHRRSVEERERLWQITEKAIRARRREREVRSMIKTMVDALREEGEARGEERGVWSKPSKTICCDCCA